MRPIKIGDTGRGVKDIQRRLMRLGYSLEPAGADGDFRDVTRHAVEAFQHERGIEATGQVDARTWSELVDSTFVFGDRSLYLRRPHFHGQDVRMLQNALVALGFSGAEIDGIFGPTTEHAVTDFQKSMGIPPDGAVGQQTYEALNGLKHIWDNREVRAHSAATTATLDRERTLMRHSWCFASTDKPTRQIVRRLVNLASASAEHATVSALELDECAWSLPEDAICVIIVPDDAPWCGESVAPVPYAEKRALLIQSFRTAISTRTDGSEAFALAMPASALDATNKLQFQLIAAAVLDALCVVFE